MAALIFSPLQGDPTLASWATGYHGVVRPPLIRQQDGAVVPSAHLLLTSWEGQECCRHVVEVRTPTRAQSDCLLHGELVWLDAISEKCHFETYIHHWLPGSSPVDPGNSKRGRSLEKDYLIRNIKRLGKNSVVGKLVEKRC